MQSHTARQRGTQLKGAGIRGYGGGWGLGGYRGAWSLCQHTEADPTQIRVCAGGQGAQRHICGPSAGADGSKNEIVPKKQRVPKTLHHIRPNLRSLLELNTYREAWALDIGVPDVTC